MLTLQEIVLAFALIGVCGGWALARYGRRPQGRNSRGDPNHRIRALEADLRVVQRKAEEAELALERHREETEKLREQLQTATTSLAERDDEARRLRHNLTDECGKTQKLRGELTQRIEESVRATVRVRDAETELSVARAGSEAVLEQVQKLAAERDELTGRVRVLQAELGGRGPQPKPARAR